MKIVFGLGNPGGKYAKTRHNIGFAVIDKFLQSCDVGFTKKYRDSIVSKCVIEGEEVLFVKPQMYMNLSGGPAKKIIEKYNCSLSEILVILDDISIPLGKIRIREKGSSGGHNGLKSISNHLTTTSFPRLRIGVGNSLSEDTKKFVLSRFTKEENSVIQDAIDKACKVINYWVTTDIKNCMCLFN
ncbi:peptidyl-tRNA hydrolase [Candidatus Scalindua japonica]|uniref:Peptidyl-tRNA hydrolase n=1 Tax=Candidatus Scalindua japonica TaxID=1284222 RepID=A0A286U219_9BACT|nr:aminoacyl-tRNA hydrolase [Candidatus Scalindua japonica]GAX62188.1 peptidyl-tRNA hydrolase [Candidatus Scalindua japonica]